MTKRIFFDGLNLGRERGTGIATYTRVLAKLARDLGHETGVLYNSVRTPSKNPLLREIGLFGERPVAGLIPQAYEYVDNIAQAFRTVQPAHVVMHDVVIARQFENRRPAVDYNFLARNIFENAHEAFSNFGRLITLDFDIRPDIMHCTYHMPLRTKAALNVCTIHDLVPLRLPFTTRDNKRRTYRLLKKIVAEYDHIVTVSEHARRDIIELLGADEKRVTNTYEAVDLPAEYVALGEAEVSEQLSGSFGLDYRGYLLFYGAFEPKKNIARIIDAYLASGADIPLVIVTSQGWSNDAEARKFAEQRKKEKEQEDQPVKGLKRRVIRFEYVSLPTLISLIKGARALVFPSLYEGFGLPVLEAMSLGTPVLTSDQASLPEVAGDAALIVDPYDTHKIARGITTIAQDGDLRAELVKRGHVQAELFSLARYRARVEKLYAGIG